ncbi:hypothetical protein D1007_00838 [Hordeum vulgare]|nr:hypothetical protein D1007_00838 [Hordeum vulgare]
MAAGCSPCSNRVRPVPATSPADAAAPSALSATTAPSSVALPPRLLPVLPRASTLSHGAAGHRTSPHPLPPSASAGDGAQEMSYPSDDDCYPDGAYFYVEAT